MSLMQWSNAAAEPQRPPRHRRPREAASHPPTRRPRTTDRRRTHKPRHRTAATSAAIPLGVARSGWRGVAEAREGGKLAEGKGGWLCGWPLGAKVLRAGAWRVAAGDA